MDSRIHPNKGYLKLPKIGWIKVTLNRPIKQAEIRSVTIKRLKSGVYKLSILTVNPEIIETKKQRIKETNQETSIDLGVKTFIKDSNGISIENPKHYRKAEKCLIKAQKTVSRRFTEGEKSKNYIKASKKLAKMHEKVRNQRKDFHHKLSNQYINENQVIYIEDLNVYGMLQNHKLAKSVQDCGWSSFINMLKYKAKWTGREIIEVNRFFPSSKLCHVCGHKKEDLTLKDRFWECPNCKTFHDRDENAAYNILREGQKVKYCTAGTAGNKPVLLRTTGCDYAGNPLL
jgi:putative transposase